MQKKRILIFSHIYLPYIGGAEIAIKEITDRVSGIEFVMITGWRDRKLKRREKVGNVDVHRIGVGLFQVDQYLYPFVAPFVALRLYRAKRFSAAWAMMPSQAGMAALVFKLFKSRVPYLLTDQSGDSDAFWKWRTFFWQPLFRQIFRRADRVQVISAFLADRAKRFGYTKKIDIIPNGVDIKHFSQEFTQEKRKNLRKKLGIGDDEKVIISTSRLMYKNGMDILIRAFKILDSRFHGNDREVRGNDKEKIGDDEEGGTSDYEINDVRLLIAGWGDDEQKLKKLTHDLGLEKRVLFLGSIPNENIPLYLSISDVFVRPSRSEGQGISFLEAMAAGVPVIAPLVGGIPDFLKDLETGIACSSEDPEDLAQKIEQVLRDTQLREHVTRNAQELVRNYYDWETISRQMKEFFE